MAAPPTAKRRPHRLEAHGDARTDDYFWLRERDSPEVRAHLESENAYTEAMTAHTREIETGVYEEIVGRIKQTDTSVPCRLDGFYYYHRFEDGKQYPIFCRKQGTLDNEEQIMLDVNAMACGHVYYQVGRRLVSPDTRLIAFAVDTVGRRKYTIQVKNLEHGSLLPDTIADVTGGMTWANDNRTLFYAKQDPETLRSYRIYRHELGTDPAGDTLVFEEQDETFSTYVFKSRSRQLVMIGSYQTVASEIRYLDANDPTGDFRVLIPRRRHHEYDADHYGDHFYIRTNAGATNFKLVRAPASDPAESNWTEVIPHRDDVFVESFQIFRDYLVVEERKDGLVDLRVRPWDGEGEHYLDFGEPAYLACIGANPEANSSLLRFEYSSMTTPDTTYDYDLVAREKKLLKRQEVLGGFDPGDYVTERLHATADDGARVPISIVYKRGLERDGKNPTVVYGYGSYGNSLDATFSIPRLSLLDRGFVYAIAHIRGGEELGRRWYEGGKLLEKKNTFTDFIVASEHLVEAGYADPQRLYAMGGSAGGLLVGAVINMRPDLYHGAVAAVPFVDVITTMLDDEIPLTTSEFDEWGNPNDRQYYEYMKSYSPYDNVEAREYPNLLVTAGLHDSQVQYWEPAKWVAKLRALKTDDNRLLLKTEMGAGHGGPSGRYERYREVAFRYAFIIDLARSRA